MLSHCEDLKKNNGTPIMHENKTKTGIKYTFNKSTPSIFSLTLDFYFLKRLIDV